jgi:hypothetical protein
VNRRERLAGAVGEITIIGLTRTEVVDSIVRTLETIRPFPRRRLR